MKKIQTLLLLLTLLSGSIPPVYAQDGTPGFTNDPGGNASTVFVTRGRAVHDVVETFDLRQKNATFITDCLQHLDQCFFVFAAMTRYDGMSLDPLRLYPDVSEAYVYAEDVHLATMLGLVHGNIDVKGSPFYPRAYMTRIQALKVVLGAGNLLTWREKFELVRDLGNEDDLRNQTTLFKDVNALRDDSWWYPRYVNFALETGIIDAGEYFRPDEPITEREYREMLERAFTKSATYYASKYRKDQPPADSSQQAVR